MIVARDYVQGDDPITVLVITESERSILKALVDYDGTHDIDSLTRNQFTPSFLSATIQEFSELLS